MGSRSIRCLLGLILALGLALRLYDINWDNGYHLHPDERFLTMVATDARLPGSFIEYLDPDRSTLVPYNIGHRYFTYGAFPVALTKVVAVLVGMDSYDHIALVGRALAALFDTATILAVYLLAQTLWAVPLASLGAALCYALAVLGIQHGHFFVVDPFGNALFAFSLLALVRYRCLLAAGLLFGAALGCKVSFVLQAPLVGLALLAVARSWSQRIAWVAVMTIATYVGLRLSDPKFFESAFWLNPSINPQFVANLLELKRLSDYAPHPWPPGVQWLSKMPVLFAVQNFVLYGFGIAATLLALVGIRQNLRNRNVVVLAGWSVFFMLYSGLQFLQTMRYLYPIYPLVALLAGLGFAAWWQRFSSLKARVALMVALFLWPLAFMQIYVGDHPRVIASRWLLEHLPAREGVVAHEHWDDSLPLRIPGYEFNVRFVELPVFEADSPEKISLLRERAERADFVVFSSNRGWGSLMPLREQFPLTGAWYDEMFSGEGDFERVFHMRRTPSLFGLTLSNNWADEAFSVYDHPEVFIFARRGLRELTATQAPQN